MKLITKLMTERQKNFSKTCLICHYKMSIHKVHSTEDIKHFSSAFISILEHVMYYMINMSKQKG